MAGAVIVGVPARVYVPVALPLSTGPEMAGEVSVVVLPAAVSLPSEPTVNVGIDPAAG
jgi:hypothetical protein